MRSRILRGLEIHQTATARELHIRFRVPIRYLRHSPVASGDFVEIQVEPLTLDRADSVAATLREALRPPRGAGLPVLEVTYEGDGLDQPLLDVRFTRRLDFQVRQGTDFRSLILVIPKAAPPPAPQPGPTPSTAKSAPAPKTPAPRRTAAAPPVPVPLTIDDAAEADAVMREARRALQQGELDRAVALLEKAIHGFGEKEHPYSREARELLGLARERKGQLAHAVAEYEAYLERYPQQDDARFRVSQRLQALITARDEGSEPLRPGRQADGLDWDVYGSVGVSYRRDVARNDLTDRLVGDSSLLTDAFVSARVRTERFDILAESAGTYLFDFTSEGDDTWRANTLFAEIDDRQSPWSAVIGRQTGNTAGIIGRFDGVRASYEISDHWSVSGVGGFPVETFVSNSVDTSRWFTGVSLDSRELIEGLETQIFAIHQRADGTTDRSALGGEFRYVRDRWFLAGLLDVDAHFAALNTALLTGNWLASDKTAVNFLVDYRKTPTLVTRNAVLGQPEADSLDELRSRVGVSTGDLEDLARDRTATSKTARMGFTHRLSDRFQAALDVFVSHIGGTRTSAGVQGFEGSGLQTGVFGQLIGSSLVRDGDVGSVGLRYTEGEDVDLTTFFLNLRYPLTRRMRLTPQVQVDYRQPDGFDDVLSIRPSLRLDHRVGPFTFDAEAGYRWDQGERFPGAGNEQGYFFLLGIRYDFNI